MKNQHDSIYLFITTFNLELCFIVNYIGSYNRKHESFTCKYTGFYEDNLIFNSPETDDIFLHSFIEVKIISSSLPSFIREFSFFIFYP